MIEPEDLHIRRPSWPQAVGVYAHGGMEFIVEVYQEEESREADGGTMESWRFRLIRGDGKSFDQHVSGFISSSKLIADLGKASSDGPPWESAWNFAWHVAKMQIDSCNADGRDFFAPREPDSEEGEEWKNGK